MSVKGDFIMLTITIKNDDKAIYEAEGDGVMDVLIAFAFYSSDEVLYTFEYSLAFDYMV